MESLVHAMLSNALAAAVLTVVVAGLARACRRPALIHGLCLVVMLKLVTPPLVPVAMPVVEGIAAASMLAAESDRDQGMEQAAPAELPRDAERISAVEPQCADIASAEEPNEPTAPMGTRPPDAGTETLAGWPVPIPSAFFQLPAGWMWEHVVLFVVLSGAIAWWVLAMLRIISFQRLLRELAPVPAEWQSRVDELAACLALSRSPRVFLVPGRVPPMLWAIGGRPRLLVPSELWSVMSADQRASLLLHELAHLKRRDHWVRWLELIVGGLYWWHPAVWWIRRSLREAEEQCCDAWVVWAMPQGVKTYAVALLSALEFVSGARIAPATASATSGSGHVSSLKRRMRMIVRANTPRGLSWAGSLAVLGTAVLLLPLAPTWAEPPEPDQPSAGAEVLDQVGFSTVVNDAQDRDQAAAPDVKSESAARVLDLEQYLTSLFQDDAKDSAANDDSSDAKNRDASKRFEDSVKHLIAKIGSELGPFGDEVRQALEKSVDDLHQSLQKDKVTIDELRQSLEKSYEEIRQAFAKRGPVDNELREAWERSRGELRQELSKSREEMRQQLREGFGSARRQQREMGRNARGRGSEGADSPESGADAKSQEQPGQAELETARKEVRELQQQLNRATRRLAELQRREVQRRVAPRAPSDPTAKPSRDRDPNTPASPRETDARSPRVGAPAREPATPRQPTPPIARRPLTPGRDPGAGGSGSVESRRNPEYDRRFRELDNKLDRLLKELEKLREGTNPKASKDPNPRSGRPAKPGAAVA
jgi:bla regulator protein blaR1